MQPSWAPWPRDIVKVTGVDTATFLQSQISQDIRALRDLHTAWTFVLQPNGKVNCLARLYKVNDTFMILDTDVGYGQGLLDRLSRFKIRVKVDLSLETWDCVAVRGSGAGALNSGAGVTLACDWPGVEGVDLMGSDIVRPINLPEMGLMDLDRIRIEAGWPVMGAELNEDTIPAETGMLPLAVSFTKGCYPGQELVERIDSRGGNVARRLRLLRSDGFMEPGAVLADGPKEVGRITSVAFADEGGTVGLGYVGRSVEPGAVLGSGDNRVEVSALGSV